MDLRDAQLDPAGATLEINALFGGGNLVVPEDWKVETSVIGIGGVGDGRPKYEREPDAPTLRVEGKAIFGGWGITSRGPRRARRRGLHPGLTPDTRPADRGSGLPTPSSNLV